MNRLRMKPLKTLGFALVLLLLAAMMTGSVAAQDNTGKLIVEVHTAPEVSDGGDIELCELCFPTPPLHPLHRSG